MLYKKPVISGSVLLSTAVVYYVMELSGMSMIRALANSFCLFTLAVFIYAQVTKKLKKCVNKKKLVSLHDMDD